VRPNKTDKVEPIARAVDAELIRAMEKL